MSEGWAVEIERATGGWFIPGWGDSAPHGLAIFSFRAQAWEAQRVFRAAAIGRTRVRRVLIRPAGR
jgi:hypothetical protein